MNSTRQNRVYSGSRAYKIKTVFKSIFAASVGIALIAVFHISSRLLTSDESNDTTASTEVSSDVLDSASPNSPFDVKTVNELQLKALSASDILPIGIQTLVRNNKFAEAKKRLLQLALLAVENEDHQQLAGILSQLGEVALLQSDMDTAEVYLAEALDLFNQTHNEIAVAGVYQQFGRLHLVTRQRARLASAAYDTLLIARWKISKGQFYSAETELRRSAEDNLSLNRYGAAASAYETLYKGYSSEGDNYQALLAGVEAVKLHASSGRTIDAENILNDMRQLGFNESDFIDMQAEIAVLNNEFKQSVLAIGTARDQAQLYNQLQARGDVVNAWRFRQQADLSLAKASTRAQYRRQPDVLVELYKSNFSMENAKKSLQRAQEVYRQNGIDTQELEFLQEQIF